MKTRLAAGMICISAAALCATEPATTYTTASIEATSDTQWVARPWGELGVKRLATAPFPDESRMNGFKSKRGAFPYEGHYDDNTVAFAIPQGFQSGNTVDFIVHFHGHSNEAQRALYYYKLGEQLRDSGRNAIVIVPQGGKNVPDEDIGQFEKPEGFSRFMAEVMDTLQHDKKVPQDAKLGGIILSGHSGGYWPIAKVLDKGGLTSSTREVWLFDAAYGGLNEISAPFANPKGNIRLRSVFTDHLTTKNMQIKSNITMHGRKCSVFEEDQLATTGTSNEEFKAGKYQGPGAGPGKDQLLTLLRSEPILFLHTSLEHDKVPMQHAFFEKFAKESPFLTETKK